ncbi:tail fiber assembly protein [Pseudomonas mosselii]|uniref:Tail fiber assembly protein n=1 Tax=Pseudomonas mosselii TaxID=78327 RepID=A0AA42UNB0_9PSED|nr:tail fiber assembly protein [Pseudomonas mosselii]MDH1629291.1 tail fiber assembly protein [Pseudomonas mosselii]
MTIYFSKTEQTFFDDEVNSTIPADAKVISAAAHAALFAGVAAGKGIDFSGAKPALIDLPPPTVEQLRETAFAQRDKGLSIAALRIAPLQDAVDLGNASDDVRAKLTKWKQYRVDLNDIDQHEGFPQIIDWPQPPE